MKLFAFETGILISIASIVAACSDDTAAPAGKTPDGGASGSTSTGGSSGNTGGSSGTGGKATGGSSTSTGGASTGTGGASTGTGGASTGTGGSSNTGGAAGDGGPSGDGSTGDGGGVPTCTDYCALEEDKCGFAEPLADNAQFTNNGACMAACNGYATTGAPGASSGDTLQCRMTHLGFINTAQYAHDHCPHTGETPTAFCK